MTEKEPVDYYRLCIADSLLQNVLGETNHYGAQYVQSHQDYLTSDPRARSHNFVKRSLQQERQKPKPSDVERAIVQMTDDTGVTPDRKDKA